MLAHHLPARADKVELCKQHFFHTYKKNLGTPTEADYSILLRDIQKDGCWGGSFFDGVFGDLLGVHIQSIDAPQRRLDATHNAKFILRSKPSLYLVSTPGHFKVAMPTPFTREEKQWTEWLERAIKKYGKGHTKSHQSTKNKAAENKSAPQTAAAADNDGASFDFACLSGFLLVAGGALVALAIAVKMTIFFVPAALSVLAAGFFMGKACSSEDSSNGAGTVPNPS